MSFTRTPYNRPSSGNVPAGRSSEPKVGLGASARPRPAPVKRAAADTPPGRSLRWGRRRSRWIAGIDIGTTKVCVILAEVLHDGQIAIRGVGSAPSRGMQTGVVTNIGETVQAIRTAYDQAFRWAGVRPREVLVGIAGDHISGMNMEGMVEVSNPEAGVDARDCRRAEEKALKMCMPLDTEVLHTFIKEYQVNGQGGLTNPVGLFGQHLKIKMHVVTGAIAASNNIFRCMRRAGCRTSGVVLQSLASSLAVLTARERELGVVLVDIGGGTSDLAIFHNRTLQYTSEIAMGGDIITYDISKVLRCSTQDAENLKKKFGHAAPAQVDADERIELPSPALGRERRPYERRLLAEIIEARVYEILEEVQKHLELSKMEDRVYAGLVLTGGTALLEGIDFLAERFLDMPCRIGRPDGMLDMNGAVNTPIYATGVGLIRWAAEEGPGFRRDPWLVRKLKMLLDVYG